MVGSATNIIPARGISPLSRCSFELLIAHSKWDNYKINEDVEMNNTKLETIQFHNQSLVVLNHENKPYIAMKPICENIGLDWHAQRQRIHRHHVLSKGEVMMVCPHFLVPKR